jgi:hypothetical protein
MVAIPSWLSGGYSDQLWTQRGVVVVPISIAIGAAGASTLGLGTARVTVTHTGTGVYSIALASGGVTRLLGAIPTVDNIAAAATTDGTDAYLTTNSVTSSSAPLLVITTCATGTLTAADPKSGATIWVLLILGTQ